MTYTKTMTDDVSYPAVGETVYAVRGRRELRAYYEADKERAKTI